ncbi:nucleotidyltransferase family protein [Telluribacter sp. SYSU D00476]|uniref:nucleotidyltransferase family protein n=1 Tax=Telluribacter sp. SYSU D00476 TaxID=2811430 RepID=UPI001FF2102C|nr:nucleotidyltransferase domain-containing protein [Telluribacter sp. SYSU D00476]
MNQLLSQNLPQIEHILRKNKVRRAYAFGSVCTERFNESSDVDILVAFEDGLDPIEYGDRYFEILDSLQTLLGRDVDLVTEKSLKSSYFIKQVDKTKVAILG